MARPAHLFGAVQLRVYGPDTTTELGVLGGVDGQGQHSKRFDESTLSFSANQLEGLVASDETALEGAFVVPEVWYGAAWTPFSTPYLLSPGTGRVLPAPRQHSPVAASALQALLEECIIFPTETDADHATFRKSGGLERNRYFHFGSKGYQETLHTWHDADVYDPTGHPKENKPADFPTVLADAEWVFRDAAEGGRTCFREPTFTLPEDQRVVFVWSSDENAKVFVDGPNQGGLILEWDADEDGYNQGFGHRTMRLKAGTYRWAAWMLTVNSEGGDGNDSARYGAYSIKTDGSGDVDQVLFVSGPDTRVLRQSVSDEIPGMSPGETMRRALETCSDLGSEAADLLLANKTFTDTLDTDGQDWTTLVEWVWPLGTSLASAFADLLAEVDLDMGPAFSFDAWQDRGGDHGATPGSGLLTVEIKPGADPPSADMNIIGYDYTSDPAGPNAFLTESQEGNGLYEGTVSAGERRRYGALESGASGSVGRANSNARKAVKANGDPRRYYTAQIIAVTGAVPWDDFTVCDVVHGCGYRNLGLDLEVTAIGWEQSEAMVVSLTLAEPTP